MTTTTWSVRRLAWPIAGGLLGALALTALYLGLVTLAESWTHALDLVREDAPFVVPIILGFGIQVGLFVYMKRGLHLPDSTRTAGALTGAGTGTSTLAMVACCAHHVTDVLPLVGLSAAAVFLAEYKVWFMAVGLVTNLIGIAFMLRLLRRERHQALAVLRAQEVTAEL
ncbi:MAG: hypothetical protein ACE5F6_21585 [Anaerolineae bacterium]